MNRKERVIRMLQRQDENVTYEQLINKVAMMREIEIGLEEAERGEGTEHEELFERLEKEWHKKESKSSGGPEPKKVSKRSVPKLPKTPRSEPTRSRSA